jgi:phage terminase small subunit
MKAQQRYELFAREYVIDLNATRAAIASGYSEASASSKGSQLLKIVKVKRLIDALQSKRASRLDIKADKIVEELSRLGFSNMLDYLNVESGEPRLDFSALTRDQAAAIQEIKEDTTGGSGDGERKLVLRTTFKLADKAKSLELLGRHLGMFQDNLKVTGIEGLADKLSEIRKAKHAVAGA